MRATPKTNKELIRELEELRQRLAELEASEAERKRAEEALRESEQRYRALFEGTLDGVFVIDAETMKVVLANEAAANLFGFDSAEDAVGMDPLDFVPPADRDRVIRIIAEDMFAQDLHQVNEFRTITRDGREIWIRAIGARIEYQGRLAGLISLCEITERKQAEEAIRESEEKLRLMFDSVADIIIVTDLKGVVTDFNEKALEMSGFSSREEALGKNILDFIADEDRVTAMAAMLETITKGLMENKEFNFKKADGTPLLAQFSASLLKDAAGNNIGLIGIGRDITERKRAEEALRASEEKFYKAFRSSPASISITELKYGKFIEVNDSFTRISGYTREEVIGHSAIELGFWAKAEDRTRMLRILRKRGRVSNEEFDLRIKSGQTRTMLFSAEPINIGGEPCMIGMTIDITEHKQAEEQAREAETLRELDRLRTELLANISHELRTPLASIKGFATMFLDYERKLKRAEKREYLEIIDKNADRLAELIGQLLDMSHLDAGILAIDRAPTTINKLCQGVIAEAQVRSPTHRFVLDIAKKSPRVNIDARRIRQVLDNLISNAVNNSQPGTEVTVATRRTGNELLVTVTDQGAGIPQKDLTRVFEALFRSKQRKLTEEGGVGLGLSICKGIVEAHDGRIWIESEEGKGTRCFFTLPLYTGQDDRHGKKA